MGDHVPLRGFVHGLEVGSRLIGSNCGSDGEQLFQQSFHLVPGRQSWAFILWAWMRLHEAPVLPGPTSICPRDLGGLLGRVLVANPC